MTANPVGASAAASGAADKPRSALAFGDRADSQTFLQLLVAQIKNQDPLSPQDPTAFMSQLAEFSSLEQLISINDRLGLVADAASSAPSNATADSATDSQQE